MCILDTKGHTLPNFNHVACMMSQCMHDMYKTNLCTCILDTCHIRAMHTSHVYEWHCVYVHTGHMSRAIHYLISIIRHMCMHDMSHVHTWHVTCVWMTQIMYIQDTCHMIHISIYMSHVHAWVCMTCHMHIQNMGLWIITVWQPKMNIL